MGLDLLLMKPEEDGFGRMMAVLRSPGLWRSLGGVTVAVGVFLFFARRMVAGLTVFPLGWMLLTPTVRNRWWRLLVCAVGIALLAWGCLGPDSLSGPFLK